MDPKSVDFVIYHAECSDGHGAAWAAWKVLGNRAEYFPAKHGKPAPDVTGKVVAILDFSYDKKTTKAMIKQAKDLIIIDHHKSAMISLEGFQCAHFDLTHSGAVLSWNFFHPGVEAPKFIKHIEDRDMWKWELPYSREFSAAFDMVPFTFEAYNRMLLDSSVDDCIKTGAHILPYADMVISKVCRSASRKKIKGYDVLVANSAHWISEIGVRLSSDCDFALVWFWDHNEKYAKVSLRSFHDNIDCSSIAKKFGGGGHPQASGFEYKGNIEDLFTEHCKPDEEESNISDDE